jgi:hypothetical protein
VCMCACVYVWEACCACCVCMQPAGEVYNMTCSHRHRFPQHKHGYNNESRAHLQQGQASRSVLPYRHRPRVPSKQYHRHHTTAPTTNTSTSMQSWTHPPTCMKSLESIRGSVGTGASEEDGVVSSASGVVDEVLASSGGLSMDICRRVGGHN